MKVEVYDFEQGEALLRLRVVSKETNIYACVEAVHSMPGQGVSSSFKFGKNAGRWEGRLESLGIPYDLVTPHKWKKVMLDSSEKKGLNNKEIALNRARSMFPNMLPYLKRKKDHGRAEALLIAKYCSLVQDNIKIAIGIDPGQTGAMAIIMDEDVKCVIAGWGY